MTAQRTLSQLSTLDVRSVYSGKAGKCCCGCAGKHSYNSLHVAEASTHRGYVVTDDEVNNRMVSRVLNVVQREGANLEDDKSYPAQLVAAQVGNRVYVVYVRNGVEVVR